MLYGQNHTRHMRNSNAHHSMRLQNFLFNHQNYQLSDIVNHVCEFAQDRDGSKFIQRKLDEAPDHRKSTIFNELYTNLHALIKHRFANFVVQKFFTIGNHEQYVKLYKHIKDHFLELSLDKYGCRVVQKAIETSTPINLFCMMDKFTEENIMILAMDPNGNHVIQNVFRTAGAVPNRHIQDVIFERINTHVIEMCHHLYGCRVMQCILQYGSSAHRSHILNEIWKNPHTVILNRYGNYVVQILIRNCSPPEQSRLMQFIMGNVIDYSTNKYASNVVEACICLATPLLQQQVMQIICDMDPVRLHQFCIDASANYVVQKLMETATDAQLNAMFVKLSPYFELMLRYVCGRKIIDKIKAVNANTRINEIAIALLQNSLETIQI